MKGDIDPEEYGLQSSQVLAQNKAVLDAKARQRELEDEKALDDIAKAWTGRRIPDEWDPNSHPMFMTDVDKEASEGNPYVKAMTDLLIEDPPQVKADNLKTKGNLAMKRGPKHFNDAIKYYTEALAIKSPDPEQNSIILSNRAAVQLLKKNYGKVIEDCEEAIALHPSNAKAYFRAAKASNSLEKWQKALEFCESGLKQDAENKEMIKEMDIAKAGLKKKEDAVKIKKAAEARKLLEEGGKSRKLRKACDERGVVLGEPIYKELASQSGRAEAFVDDEGSIHWPMLFLYDEYDQSDFLQDVGEDCCLNDIVSTVLDPAQPRPDWDVDGRYIAGKVNAYYATHQCKPLEGSGAKKEGAPGADESFISSLLSGSERKGIEDEIKRVSMSKWMKVDLDMPLHTILQEEDHVVPGLPVFHIVSAGSFFERHLLATPPDKI